MSRFNERLTDDLREIAAQASLSPRPADELVERIRADHDVEAAEVIAFVPAIEETQRSPLALIAAVAAIVLVVVVGLVAVTSNRPADEVPADRPNTSLPSPSPPTVPPATTVAPRPSTELPPAGQIVDAGVYGADMIDVSITFDLPTATGLWSTTPGRIAFIDADPGGGATSAIPSNTRDLEFIRLAGWTSPVPMDAADAGAHEVFEPFEVELWIEENDLAVEELAAASVAGRYATTFDLRADALSGIGTRNCPTARAPCFWFADVAGDDQIDRDRSDPLLYAPTVNRFWLIEVSDGDPLLVHAAAGLDDTAWLDLVASTTIETLTIDPTDPQPGDASADG
jgi:hypothetical protein